MISIKGLKRRVLIKTMSVLGFGGMAAYCLAGCSPTQSDVLPAGTEQKSDTQVAQEQIAQSQVADEKSDDANVDEAKSDDAAEKEDPRPVPERMVTKYGIMPPVLDIPVQIEPDPATTPDVSEKIDAGEKTDGEKTDAGESDEARDSKKDEVRVERPKNVPRPVTAKYGVPGVRPPVKKYGVRR